MKKAIILLLFVLLLTSCGNETSPDETPVISEEMTPHNKDLTESAVKDIDDFLNGKCSKHETNDKLMALFKDYEIKGRLVDAKVAECAMYVVDNNTDKVIEIRNDLAESVGIDNFSPAPQLSNDEIDKIIEITNNYLLGNITNEQAKSDLLELYTAFEDSGGECSDDMKQLFMYISMTPDPKEHKKEVMKYRNNIAILKGE